MRGTLRVLVHSHQGLSLEARWRVARPAGDVPGSNVSRWYAQTGRRVQGNSVRPWLVVGRSREFCRGSEARLRVAFLLVVMPGATVDSKLKAAFRRLFGAWLTY